MIDKNTYKYYFAGDRELIRGWSLRTLADQIVAIQIAGQEKLLPEQCKPIKADAADLTGVYVYNDVFCIIPRAFVRHLSRNQTSRRNEVIHNELYVVYPFAQYCQAILGFLPEAVSGPVLRVVGEPGELNYLRVGENNKHYHLYRYTQ